MRVCMYVWMCVCLSMYVCRRIVCARTQARMPYSGEEGGRGAARSSRKKTPAAHVRTHARTARTSQSLYDVQITWMDSYRGRTGNSGPPPKTGATGRVNRIQGRWWTAPSGGTSSLPPRAAAAAAAAGTAAAAGAEAGAAAAAAAAAAAPAACCRCDRSRSS